MNWDVGEGSRNESRHCCKTKHLSLLPGPTKKKFEVLVIQQAAFVGEGDSKVRALYCRFGIYSGLAIHLG
jgi:hypothetical protein